MVVLNCVVPSIHVINKEETGNFFQQQMLSRIFSKATLYVAQQLSQGVAVLSSVTVMLGPHWHKVEIQRASGVIWYT